MSGDALPPKYNEKFCKQWIVFGSQVFYFHAYTTTTIAIEKLENNMKQLKYKKYRKNQNTKQKKNQQKNL